MSARESGNADQAASFRTEDDADLAAIFGTVREATAAVVADGIATLKEGTAGGGRFLHLVPVRRGACDVKVYPPFPTLCLGPEQHCTELFGPEDVRMRDLQRLIKAVIDGRYSWEHRQVQRKVLFIPLYRFTRLIGTFDTPDGPWVFYRQGGQPREAVAHKTYEPYRE